MDNNCQDIDYCAAYKKLAERVKTMLATQQKYFKTRDKNVLRQSKAIEAEVSEMVNPKPKQTSQATINWLAQ